VRKHVTVDDRIVIWNGSLCASYGPCLPSRPCEAGRYPVLCNTMPPFTIHSPSPQSRIRATGDDASQLLGLSVYQSIASSVLTPTCLPHSSWTFRKRYRISSSHFARDHPCSHSAGVPRTVLHRDFPDLFRYTPASRCHSIQQPPISPPIDVIRLHLTKPHFRHSRFYF
jgi:hypothetical protein